jgi:hypothetical protein
MKIQDKSEETKGLDPKQLTKPCSKCGGIQNLCFFMGKNEHGDLEVHDYWKCENCLCTEDFTESQEAFINQKRVGLA